MNKYKAIFEGLPIGLSIISPRMEILELNAKMREWFPGINVEKKPTCYKTFNVPPRHEICDYCPTVETFEDGKVHTAITETSSSDKIVNCRVTSSPVFDEEGRVATVLYIWEDVTEKLRRENELREYSGQLEETVKEHTAELKESEAKFKTLFENASDAIFLVDERERYIDVNEKALDLSGYSKKELIGKTIKDLIPPGTPLKIFPKILREGAASGEFELLRKDGALIPVELRGVTIEIGGRKIVQGIVRDISERKRAEEEILRTKEFLNSVIDCSADAIVTTNAEGIITTWSRGAEVLYGYSAEKIIGKSIDALYPKELKEERMKWQESITEGKTLRNVETKVYNSNGDLVDISLSLAPLKDECGKIIGTVEVSKDITQRKRVENELNKRLEELERWHKATIGRELKMVDLKKRIKDLEEEIERLGGTR